MRNWKDYKKKSNFWHLRKFIESKSDSKKTPCDKKKESSILLPLATSNKQSF